MPAPIWMFVQGEGRGHLTQAIALHQILSKMGKKVERVWVGTSAHRTIPEFFMEQMGSAEILQIESPNFTPNPDLTGINWKRSIRANLAMAPTFRRQLKTIHRAIRKEKPGLLLQFYEPLLGLYHMKYATQYNLVAIAHQYKYLHPNYEWPAISASQKLGLKMFSMLTAASATCKIALSLNPLPEREEHYTLPPLLRQQTYALADEGVAPTFDVLIYLLNPGFISQLANWCHNNPSITVRCYTDSNEIHSFLKPSPNLTLLSLAGDSFLRDMAEAKSYAGTAGFESVAEALLLDKKVLMVPSTSHFEQLANALDAHKQGLAVHADHFDLDALLSFRPDPEKLTKTQDWIRSAPELFQKTLEPYLPA